MHANNIRTAFEYRYMIRPLLPAGHGHVDRAEYEKEEYHVNRPNESANRVWQVVEMKESGAWR
jgi:hypothetical protein